MPAKKTPAPTPALVPRHDTLRDFSRSLPMALLKAREAVMGRFRPMLRQHDITEQQWRVLRALSSSTAPLRASELAQMTFLSMPSLSRLLKTLESRRVISRSVHEDDQRAAQLSITRSGRALVAQIAPLSEGNYAEIAALIGDRDLDQLYGLLHQVVVRLGESNIEDSAGD